MRNLAWPWFGCFDGMVIGGSEAGLWNRYCGTSEPQNLLRSSMELELWFNPVKVVVQFFRLARSVLLGY